MLISVALKEEQSISLISLILLYCLTLILLSLWLDGPANAIVAPFWTTRGNPRKAFNKYYNKKIIDLIHQIKG
jgi:hypothetical protein